MVDYSAALLQAMSQAAQQAYEKKKLDEAFAQKGQMNALGGLAGLFAGGLQSGKMFSMQNDESGNPSPRIDLSGLLTPEAGLGALGGAFQETYNTPRDIFAGGFAGAKTAQDYQKSNLEQAINVKKATSESMKNKTLILKVMRPVNEGSSLTDDEMKRVVKFPELKNDFGTDTFVLNEKISPDIIFNMQGQ